MVDSEQTLNYLGRGHPLQDWFIRAQQLISLILAQAAIVNAFKGRWMIISNKVDQLAGAITSLASSSCREQVAILKDLVPHIIKTLEEGRDSAKTCTDFSYGGKLLLQSNLDRLATKLDLHLRDLQLLVKSGILKETVASAKVQKEMSFEAEREVAKLYVWDLFARLKIGNGKVKMTALSSLIDYLKEDSGRVALVVDEGDMPYLIDLLDSRLAGISEKAADAVSILAESDICRQFSAIESAHAPLIRLLETGTPVAKEKAAQSLLELSYTKENAFAITSLGGASALVEMCRNGTPAAKALAAGALRNLSSDEEIKKCLAEEHALIPSLINLVTCGTELAQEHAGETLMNLASGEKLGEDSNKFRQQITKYGGLQTLMMYLHRSSTSPKAQEIAIRALANLSASNLSNAKALIAAGYLHQLATAISVGTSNSVQQLAASAISSLVSASVDMRIRVIGDVTRILPLARKLEANSSRAEHAQALSNLLLHNNSNSSTLNELCRQRKAISGVVQFMDSGNQNKPKRLAMPEPSRCNKCRKRMAAAARKLRNIFSRHLS